MTQDSGGTPPEVAPPSTRSGRRLGTPFRRRLSLAAVAVLVAIGLAAIPSAQPGISTQAASAPSGATWPDGPHWPTAHGQGVNPVPTREKCAGAAIVAPGSDNPSAVDATATAQVDSLGVRVQVQQTVAEGDGVRVFATAEITNPRTQPVHIAVTDVCGKGEPDVALNNVFFTSGQRPGQQNHADAGPTSIPGGATMTAHFSYLVTRIRVSNLLQIIVFVDGSGYPGRGFRTVPFSGRLARTPGGPTGGGQPSSRTPLGGSGLGGLSQ